MRRSKNDHLVILVSFLQALICVGSHVDSCINGFTCRKSYGDWKVELVIFNVVYAVD